MLSADQGTHEHSRSGDPRRPPDVQTANALYPTEVKERYSHETRALCGANLCISYPDARANATRRPNTVADRKASTCPAGGTAPPQPPDVTCHAVPLPG